MASLLDRTTLTQLLRYLADHYPNSVGFPASFGEKINAPLRDALSELKEAGLIDYTFLSFRNGMAPLPKSLSITEAGLSYLETLSDI